MEEIRQSQILDSGERREFETGAVRDIQEGKGRCDLLPLDAVSGLIGNEQDENGLKLVCVKTILEKLALFQYTKHVNCIKDAVYSFQFSEYQGNGCTTFASMILDVSKHFEEGAKKYGEHNWEKGIPTHCYLDSGVRHLMKWLRGDDDEPHGRAFVWNMICLIWTLENQPQMDDMITYSWDQQSENVNLVDSNSSDLNDEDTPEDFEEPHSVFTNGAIDTVDTVHVDPVEYVDSNA